MTQYLVNACLMMIWKGIITLLFAAVVNNILQSIIYLLHIKQNDSEKIGYLSELKTISAANSLFLHFGKHTHCPSRFYEVRMFSKMQKY